MFWKIIGPSQIAESAKKKPEKHTFFSLTWFVY
jgi:hypothetical protein